MSTVELDAQQRQLSGKKVRALRRQGILPANIVSRGKDSRAIQVDTPKTEKVLKKVGFTQPVELSIGNDKVTALVTDISYSPARNEIEHITFQEIRKGEKVTAQVPLRLVGDAPGVQKALIMIQLEDTLEVEAGGMNIPEFLEIDVSGLVEEGDSVRFGAVKLPSGVELKSDPEAPVARLEAPQLQEEISEEPTADAVASADAAAPADSGEQE